MLLMRIVWKKNFQVGGENGVIRKWKVSWLKQYEYEDEDIDFIQVVTPEESTKYQIQRPAESVFE